MTEAEVVEQLVQFTHILLAGVSLIFSVVSAYVVALNYFIGSAAFLPRLGGFLFITLVLAMLVAVMMGAQSTQMGLIARLIELEAQGELTAAGRAVLANASAETGVTIAGYSVDEIIRWCVWGGLSFLYLALAYMSFLHRWRPDAIPVTIEEREPR